MYAVKYSDRSTVRYWMLCGGGWKMSSQPVGVANELIRRSDSYKEEDGCLVIDCGIRYSLSDLERLVA